MGLYYQANPLPGDELWGYLNEDFGLEEAEALESHHRKNSERI